VRRFFCRATDCPRKIFTERLPDVAAAYARVTERLQEAHRSIGLALGGEPGARLAASLGMPTSPDSLLRRVRTASRRLPSSVRVLGVDDWAWRRGQRYGTILCDLERHRPIALLPERSSETLRSWLEEHPEVEIISRDRADDYAKGATEGAPQAVQVADRWHLLCNLREALKRAVDRHHAKVRETNRAMPVAQAIRRNAGSVSDPAPNPSLPSAQPSRATERSHHRRERRVERYQQVVELHQQGISFRAIARRMGMHRGTVRRWIGAGTFPERAAHRCSSRTDPFADYLKRRWDEGCHSAAQLARDLAGLGFRGSYHMVRRRVAAWRSGRQSAGFMNENAKPMACPSSNRIAWWMLRAEGELEDKERGFLRGLYKICPELKIASKLAREFADMVRRRRVKSWKGWMAKTRAPDASRELRRFADGLKNDEAAVKAAMTFEWSNGQVEGQINRLKLIKRQMYGRAGFELLGRRFLCAV
jgi:transposase